MQDGFQIMFPGNSEQFQKHAHGHAVWGDHPLKVDDEPPKPSGMHGDEFIGSLDRFMGLLAIDNGTLKGNLHRVGSRFGIDALVEENFGLGGHGFNVHFAVAECELQAVKSGHSILVGVGL